MNMYYLFLFSMILFGGSGGGGGAYCIGKLTVSSVVNLDSNEPFHSEILGEYQVARFSKYIGSFTTADCEENPLVGRLVSLDSEVDNVCSEKFLREGDLKGNIVVLDQVTFTSPVVEGCSIEEVFRILESHQVAGIIDYSAFAQPGDSVYLHTMGEQVRDGSIYSLSVASDFEPVWLKIDPSVNITVKVDSCENNLRIINYRSVAIPVMFVFLGYGSVYYGIFALRNVKNDNANGIGKSRNLILYVEGIQLIFVGVWVLAGLNGKQNYTIFGNETFGMQIKTVFATLLSSINFIGTVMCAMFWKEMSDSIQKCNIAKHILGTKKRQIFFVTIVLLLCSIELALGIGDAAFQSVFSSMVPLVLYLISNIIISIYFQYQLTRMVDGLEVANSAFQNRNSAFLEIQRLLAKALQWYVIVTIFQAILIVILLVTKITSTIPGHGIVLFFLAGSRILQSVIKIKGFVAKKEKPKEVALPQGSDRLQTPSVEKTPVPSSTTSGL